MKIIASAISLLASLSGCNAETPLLRATISTDDSSPSIIDLSQEMPRDEAAILSSPFAKEALENESQDPRTRNVLVLENGSIVSSYTRDDVDPNEPSNVASVTKSWMSLLFGMLVDDGLLSLDETLGDIFPDDAAWADVTDGSTDFRKSATIEELLTMTSGLFDTFEMLFGPEPGGKSLEKSFSYPLLGVKGEWAYLAASQIHSYIIKERTGMTPRQYLAENVMGKLGSAEDEYDWDQTSDGIEFGSFGLSLTPMQMAKFGQLYLQGGRTNPSNDERLISEKWIDASLTHHSTTGYSTMFGGEAAQGLSYGYTFMGLHEYPSGSIVYCASGAGGQAICVDREFDCVLVLQKETPFENSKNLGLVVDSTESESFRAPNGGLSEFSSPVESRTE